LIESARRAGASAVALVPEPLAAAVGAGLDITSPYAQMLVDIGDGVTDIAVIQSSRLVTTAVVGRPVAIFTRPFRRLSPRAYATPRHEAAAADIASPARSRIRQPNEWLFAQGK
jgi:hypothetical protein